MIQQKIFNFDFEEDYSTENFFVSRSNINAYKQVLNNEGSLNNILPNSFNSVYGFSFEISGNWLDRTLRAKS